MVKTLFRYIIPVGLISVFLGSGCTFPISGISGDELPTRKQFGKELRVVQSKILEERATGWRVLVKDSGLGDETRFFFLDSQLGWAYDKQLVRTQDGGKTWNPVGPLKTEGRLLSNVVFMDASVGWAVEQPLNSNTEESMKQSVLILSSQDGGQSWAKAMELKGVVITDCDFPSRRVGWLLGRRYYGQNPVTFDIYFAITTDGGESWSDISDRLNKAVGEAQEPGQRSKGVSFATLYDEEIRLVSNDGHIFQTNDFGRQWELLGAFPNDDPFTALSTNRMGLSDQKLTWFINASHHYSALGALTIEYHEFWSRYELDNFYFSDGVLLSENEIIVSGYRMRPNEGPIGTILHSLDGGRQWKVLLQNEDTKNIRKLQVLTKEKIVLWDRNGTVYTLVREPG